MIEALIAGEQDPARLAEMAKGKMRPKIPALTEALTGHFGAHHAVAARRILDHLDFLDTTIAPSPRRSTPARPPSRRSRLLLLAVPGLERPTIDVIVAETGADMSRFPRPPTSPRGPGSAPATTNRPASDATSAPPPATRGCDAP